MCAAKHIPLPYSIGSLRWLVLAGKLRRAQKALSEEALKTEWEAVVAVREEAGRRAVRVFERMFAEQERVVMSRLEEALDRAGAKKDADPFLIDWLFARETWQAWMGEKFEPALLNILRAGYRTGQIRINVMLPAWNETARARRVIDEVLANVAKTDGYTRNQLSTLISKALEEGVDRHEIRSRIRSQFADWKDWRADHAGQAAATGAFEEGQLEAFADGGVTSRRWLSQRDAKVRPEHDEADGQEVGIDAPFLVGGQSLMYPGDPAGEPDMIMGCRCATLPILREEPAVRSYLDRRDDQIRAEYATLKMTEPTAESARLELGERYGLSDSQIQRIIYKGARR